MNKRKIALGPGAASLILIVVVLSLCMLAMLAQIGSRNDLSLASRSASMITRVYNLSANSERKLAELDQILARCQKETQDMQSYLALVEENLPEGMEIEEDQISWTEPLARFASRSPGNFPVPCGPTISLRLMNRRKIGNGRDT